MSDGPAVRQYESLCRDTGFTYFAPEVVKQSADAAIAELKNELDEAIIELRHLKTENERLRWMLDEVLLMLFVSKAMDPSSPGARQLLADLAAHYEKEDDERA